MRLARLRIAGREPLCDPRLLPDAGEFLQHVAQPRPRLDPQAPPVEEDGWKDTFAHHHLSTSGQPETVYLSIVQSRLTAEIDWKAGRDVSLYAQAGTVRTVRFVFSEDAGIRSEKFVDDSTLPAGYLKVGARFRFGKSILDDWKK